MMPPPPTRRTLGCGSSVAAWELEEPDSDELKTMGVTTEDEEGTASGTPVAVVAADDREGPTGVVVERRVVWESKLSVAWKMGGSGWVSIGGTEG